MSSHRRCMMQNVFHNDRGCAGVGPEWIERLKVIALASPMRRSRFCLHRSDSDPLHEMIIALASDCIFRPHKHEAKSESYHMISGRMIFIMFNDGGTPMDAALLAPPGQSGTICFRISDPVYHAVLPLDDVVVYQETTSGPFRPGEATIAPWAPADPGELRAFLEKSAAAFGILPER
jgi:cupin fold WbuC family metalloprotein